MGKKWPGHRTVDVLLLLLLAKLIVSQLLKSNVEIQLINLSSTQCC